MLKKISIILLSLFFVGFLYAQDSQTGKILGGKQSTMPSWFMNSFLELSDDIDELASQDKRLMVFVEQDGCPYCHAFITKNLQDKTTKDKLQKHFGVIAINMFGSKEMVDTDGQTLTEKEFALKHKIQFTPTLIFYNEEGEQILRLNGYVDIPQFNLALDYVIGKRERDLTYKQFLSNNYENKKDAKLIEEKDLFKKSKNFMRTEGSNKMAIFFETPACKQCEVLHDTLLKDKLTRDLLKKIDVYQVDLNSSNSIVNPHKMIVKIKDWADELNITHIPTVIFFDEKGEEIVRVEAILKNYHFQSIVDYVASDAFKEEKEFQRYLTKRTDAIRAKGIDVDIWE